MRLTVFGLRPRALLRLYGWRLRRYPVQELFAGGGIAIGVALVFGVQVANTSITGSAEQLADGIRGTATLQLVARSADGFDERLAASARALPGIRRAAPVLRTRVALVGPRGRRTVELDGVTPGLAGFGGTLTRNFGPGGLRLSDGITLPSGVARSIGAEPGRHVALLVEGRVRRVLVGAVLGSETIGPLARTPVAIAPLRFAQALTGKRRRVTNVFVEPRAGSGPGVRRELERVAAGRLTVAPADEEVRLLRQAAGPNDQSTGLFSAIGAMVGVLLAFSAMLLTVPERRRFVADLRMQGFDRRQVLAVLAFEALALGLVASLFGLVLGDVLSRTVFDDTPQYLALAFPVGTQRVVDAGAVAFALAGGVLAAICASALPAFDLFSGRPIDAVFREPGEAGEAIGARTARLLFIAGVGLVGVTTLLAAAAPSTTLLGGMALALATLLFVPTLFFATVRGLAPVSRRVRRSMLPLAFIELRATTIRSVALAAVAALSVYGSVAIEGAHRDLLDGLDRTYAEYLSTADLWVTSRADAVFATEAFRPGQRTAAIARAPGVAAVRTYQGSFADLGDRRVWMIARSPRDRPVIPPNELREGDLEGATRRLAAGGWATISETIARSRRVGIGDRLALRTPSGVTRLRVAAITANVGWAPGTIILSRSDYRRAWRTSRPTALEVDLAAGVTPLEGKRRVERALGPGSGLRVQTQRERGAETGEVSRQGLSRLSQISTLLLIVAALAVAAAMGGAIWQRRPRLAALKIQGFDHRQLWRSLLLETGFVLCIGSATGALAGVYGHFLLSRWLERVSGFPAPFSPWDAPALGALALVAAVALVVAALPGYAAVRVPPRAVFQE